MKNLIYIFVFFSIFTFGQKTDINSKITFTDGRVLEAKIPFTVNIFYSDLINELSISGKKITVLENGKKIKYEASNIERIEFTDLKNINRTFVHTSGFEKTLIEKLYDGKIKWYRSFYANGYDHSKKIADILVKNDTKEVLSILSNNKKKLKNLMADKPELEALIEKVNYNRFNEEDFLELLKKYDE